MQYYKNIDWGLVWSIIKDTIIPHSGTLLFNVIIFLIIGLFLSIIYIIILSKKRVLKRRPKYYNWVVKLYIPLGIVVFLYIFGQIGFLRGVHSILNKEKAPIVTSIYGNTLSLAFESEESKNEFITEIQKAAKDIKDDSNFLVEQLKTSTMAYNTGSSLIDESKNKVAVYLIEKYGNDIYKIGTYSMINIAGAKAHVNINESLPYSEFSVAMDFLMNVGYKDIELAIKDELMVWYISLLDTQYHSMVKSLLILLLLMISIPILEFLIYKKWIEPRFINKLKKRDYEK